MVKPLVNLSVRIRRKTLRLPKIDPAPPPAVKKEPIRTRRESREATKVEDLAMGLRLRLRRTELKMSQTKLAGKLGLSFQQVQKYEKGTNRIPAARLSQLAGLLNVPIMFFYDSPDSPLAKEVESLLNLDPTLSLRLLRAYTKISPPSLAHSIVHMMERIVT